MGIGYDTIASYYIELNYRQAIIWAAIPYAPWMPAYGVLLQLFMFQITIWSLKCFCRASEHPFEDDSGTSTLFLMVITIAVAFVPTANWLQAPASESTCGPLVNVGASSRYTAMVSFVVNESPEFLRYVYTIALNPMIIYGLVIVLVVVINLMFAKNNGLKDEIRVQGEQTDLAMRMWRQEFLNTRHNIEHAGSPLPSPSQARPADSGAGAGSGAGSGMHCRSGRHE